MTCKFCFDSFLFRYRDIDVPIAGAAPLSVSPSERIETKPAIGTSIMAITIARGGGLSYGKCPEM